MEGCGVISIVIGVLVGAVVFGVSAAIAWGPPTPIASAIETAERRRTLALLEADRTTTRAAELARWTRGDLHAFSGHPPWRFPGTPILRTDEDREDLNIDARLRRWNRKRPGPIALTAVRD